MKTDSNDDIKKFVKELIKKMENAGESDIARELNDWDNDFFTTSSEFLGELKLILERIEQLEVLDSTTKKNVKDCIISINRAFGM